MDRNVTSGRSSFRTTPHLSKLQQRSGFEEEDAQSRSQFLQSEKGDAHLSMQMNAGQKVSDQQDEEIQDFLKLTATDVSEFQNKWSILIFIVNLYNFFTTWYYLGIAGFPDEWWLSLEIFSEIVLVIDIIMRCILENKESQAKFWMFREETPFSILMTSSIPQSVIFKLLENHLDVTQHWIAYWRLAKILRYGQFSTFFLNQQFLYKNQSTHIIQVYELFVGLMLITHFSGMLWVMTARHEMNEGGANDTWYDYWELDKAQKYEQYIDSIFWSTATMTSIAYGDVIPLTKIEFLVCIAVMILGASTYGAVFGSFVAIINEANEEKNEKQEALVRLKRWSEVRNLNKDLRSKLITYTFTMQQQFADVVNYSSIYNLPAELRSEVCMQYHETLAEKVKLFELADPDFIKGMVEHLEPKIFMPGDYVTTQDQYATCMYFIKSGVCEVLATDGKTVIAYLLEGAYFGEIGLLIRNKRSVSVRAIESMQIATIEKYPLLRVLKKYENFHHFLKKVGMQRLETTHPEEIDDSVEIRYNDDDDEGEEDIGRRSLRKLPTIFNDDQDAQNDQSNQSMNMHSTLSAKPKRKPLSQWLSENWCVANSSVFRWSATIDPFTKIFKITSFLIILWFGYNLFYVPICICFDYETTDEALMFLDILIQTYQIVDVFVVTRTTLVDDMGNMDRDLDKIWNSYAKQGLLSDLIASFPIDYLGIALSLSRQTVQWLRLLRFLKVFRVLRLGNILATYNSGATYGKLFLMLVGFIYLNHFSAWLFFYIGKIQYEEFPYTRYDNRTYFATFGQWEFEQYDLALIDMNMMDQYIHSLYTAYASAVVAYGDVVPVTPVEKLFAFVMMIIAKIYVAFILAEAQVAIASQYTAYTTYINRKALVQQWMTRIKLPKTMQKRVETYHDLLWKKLKGFDDTTILAPLPRHLKNDVADFLFSSFAGSEFFPKEEPGAIHLITRLSTIQMIWAGENIIEAGEVGLEMYFIIDGSADVVTEDGDVIVTFEAGTPFGEMAILNPKPSVRTATIRAKTDIAIGILTLFDFKFVMQKYPDFAHHVGKIGRKRLREQQRREQGIVHGGSDEEESDWSSGDDEESDEDNSNERTNLSVTAAEITTSSSPHNGRKVEGNLAPIMSSNSIGSDMRPIQVYSPRNASRSRSMIGKFIMNYKKFVEWNREHKSPRTFAFFFVTLYNYIFITLQIAFEIKFEGALLFLELISFFVFTIQCILTIEKYKRNKDVSIFTVIRCILAAFPFALILQNENGQRIVVVFLSLLRLIVPEPLTRFFLYLQVKNMKWNDFLRMFQVLFLYVILNHFIACMWIEVAKVEPDNTKNWLRRIPSPQGYKGYGTRTEEIEITFEDMYIHAIYWSLVTVSTIGIGDITPITPTERAFCCVVFVLGTFSYAVLFGDIAALVSGLSSQLRGKLFGDYQAVKEFLQKRGLSNEFSNQVHDYYTHIWKTELGLDSNIILEELPNTLKADIQVTRYASWVRNSNLFHDDKGNSDEQLCRSLFRMMKTKFYMAGDYIVTTQDPTKEMYLILSGVIKVIEASSGELVGVLKEGDHFGQGNIIYQLPQKCNFQAATLTKVGILEFSTVLILFDAYPQWAVAIFRRTEQRVKETMSAEEFGNLQRRIRLPRAATGILNQKLDRQFRKGSAIMAQVKSSVLPKPDLVIKEYIWIDILHLILIVVTSFTITLEIGFDLDIHGGLLAVEVLVQIESLVYLIIRTILIGKAQDKVNCWEIIKYYYAHDLVYDLLACSPFNIIFPWMGLYEPLPFILPLRLLRVLSVLKVPGLVYKIEFELIEASKFVTTAKVIYFLILLWHFSSSLWFFVNVVEADDTYKWINQNKLEDENLAVRYLYTSYFTMNVVCGVGYGDMFATTNTERIVTIVLILLGDALFAVAFGLIAAIAASQETTFKRYVATTKDIKRFLGATTENIDKASIEKIDQYYAYRWTLTEELGKIEIKDLYEMLPQTMVEQLMYQNYKYLIKDVVTGQPHQTKQIAKAIGSKLIPKIYLPQNIICRKGEESEITYFIFDGRINCLTLDEKRIEETLEKNQYFGEEGLWVKAFYYNTHVAATFWLVYILYRNDYEEIVNQYTKNQIEREREGEYIRLPRDYDKRAAKRLATKQPIHLDFSINISARQSEVPFNALLQEQINNPFGPMNFSSFGPSIQTQKSPVQRMENRTFALREDDMASKLPFETRRPKKTGAVERRFSQMSIRNEHVIAYLGSFKGARLS